MEDINELIATNAVTYTPGVTPTMRVAYSPGQTDREKEKGIIPEDVVLKPNVLSQKQVDEILDNKTERQKFFAGYAKVKDKVGDVDADILFTNYFGPALTAALSQGN